MGGEGVMIFLLFFLPAILFFCIYAILKYRFYRKWDHVLNDAAFPFDVD